MSHQVASFGTRQLQQRTKFNSLEEEKHLFSASILLEVTCQSDDVLKLSGTTKKIVNHFNKTHRSAGVLINL